jgi:fatty acid desaturase
MRTKWKGKAMDWEKGVKRFALVLAVLMGLLHCVLFIAYGGAWLDGFFNLIRLKRGSAPNDLLALLIVFLIGFLPVWGIPTAICWAIKGFKDDGIGPAASSSNPQNPTASGTNVERLRWLHKGFSKKR